MIRTLFGRFVPGLVLLATACGSVTSLNDMSPGDGGLPGMDAPPDEPQLSIDRTTISLGAVLVGQTSAPATLTITNTGSAVSGSVDASVSGTGYAISANHCAGTLAPMESCQVSVTVTPTAAGSPTGTLTVTASPGGSATSALTATALTPGALVSTPPSFDFGMTLSETASGTTMITVQNTGGQGGGVMTVALDGADPSQFEITSDACTGKGLAPNETCQLVARFHPSGLSGGQKSATVTVAATPGGTAVTTLTGTVKLPATLSGNVTTASFGQVEVGVLSGTTATWTLTNIGDLATTTPALSQTTAELEISGSTCTAAIPAGGSCSMTVRFRPSTGGARSGSLTLTISGSTATLATTATGMWRVTVQRTGTSGTITSVPAGISCAPPSTSCSGLFVPGAIVLQARTTNGSGVYFGAWSGTSAGTCASGPASNCTLNVDGVESITGSFAALTANLVFTSSATYLSNLGGTAPYDLKCNQLATAAGINNATGDNFTAWMSDSNSNVMSRLGPASGWIRMDGRAFAATQTSLLAGAILNPVRYSEAGADLADQEYFTGTLPAGTTSTNQHCNNWSMTSTANNNDVLFGSAMSGPLSWTRVLSGPCSTTPHAVLCMMHQFTTGTTPATFPGKHVWQSNTAYTVSASGSPDATCAASLPSGVTSGHALISRQASTAASLLSTTQMYVRPDGQEVGTGAEIIAGQTRGGIWQFGNGGYPAMFDAFVWTGSTALDQLGTLASTCNDWVDSTQTQAQTGDMRDARGGFWRGPTLACDQSNVASPPRLYCVEP